MTRDEFIKMAQSYMGKGKPKSAFAFAKLLEAVILMEREACAKVCEETTASWTQHLYNEGCMDCAEAIRARSNL
jgi:hypothetical protein